MSSWIKEKFEFHDLQRIMQRLIERVSFFQGLTQKELTRLLESAEKCTFEPGETIVRQGSSGAFLYIIVEGRVSVLRGPALTSTPQAPTELAQLAPGDCFGEMSLVDRDSRSASVVALSPCVLLRINERACWHDPTTSAKIFHNIARTLSRRLRTMDEAFVLARQGERNA